MFDAHLTLEVYPEGEGQNQLDVWLILNAYKVY